MKATTISIANQIGGISRTTTALCLSDALGYFNKKVLLIDFHSQANATDTSNVGNVNLTITDVICGNCIPEDAIIKCKYYDFLAADDYLNNAETQKIEPTLLKESIRPLLDSYEYIIIDTPSRRGNLLYNALVASDYVIIPTETTTLALRGINDLYWTIQNVMKINSNLNILGILLVQYNNRTILGRQITEMIHDWAKQMNTIVFKSTIRKGVAVAKSQAARIPLIDFAKDSKPSMDYEAFAKEVMSLLRKKPGRPKTITKERRTISAKISVDLLDKWEEVKFLKGGNLTEYIERLIQEDMDKTYKQLKEIIDSMQEETI